MLLIRTVLLSASVIIVPLAFLVAVRWATDDKLAGITVDGTPLIVSAVARTIDDRTGVEVELVWAHGTSVLAPAWNGVVTAVYAQRGDRISSGTALLAVAGVDRIAYRSDQPFYRPLSRGDTGSDVAQLHRLLHELGHLAAFPEDPNVFTLTTEAAVARLMSALGATEPNGHFDPAVVAWLPEDRFTLGNVAARVAAPAPAPGSVLATSIPELVDAAIASQNPNRPLSLDPGVEYVLTVGEIAFAVDPSTASVPEGDLHRLAAAVLPPPSHNLDGGEPGTHTSLNGVIMRKTPLDVLAVPATAVVTSAHGGLCIWVVAAEKYEPVPVLVHSSLAGVASIQADLALDARVLANPTAVLESPVCP